jgi:DNA invertase Pin-like site-specific DNA recombinase
MLMNAAQPRAYSYLRFSTPDQALGDSKRRQVEAARAWATERGLTLDEELADEGVSGFRGANTRDDTALGAFLRAVNAGDVPVGSVLIVESLDRLSRDRILAAQNVMTSLLLAGVTVVTLGDRREYSAESVNANPIDLIASLLVLMRANEESETKSKRLRAVWAHKRAAATSSGVRMTTKCPAWLEARPDGKGFAVRNERAEIVRRIFDETIQGKGQHRIAADLTAEGVPTWGRGKGWHRTYVRKIVDNPAVIGTLCPHVTERLDGGGARRRPVGDPVRGYYPAVIADDTWSRARAMVGSRGTAGTSGRGRHAGKAVRHVLAGIARCPDCNEAMTRVYKGAAGGRAFLVCARAKRGAGCVYKSVPVDIVESALEREVVDLLAAPPSADAGETAAREALVETERMIAVVVDERRELAEARRKRRGLLPVEREREAVLYQEQQALEDERRELLDSLATRGSRVVDARVARLWDALDQLEGEDRTEANAAARDAFSHVVIDHRTEQMVFHWRHGGESVISYAPPFT